MWLVCLREQPICAWEEYTFCITGWEGIDWWHNWFLVFPVSWFPNLHKCPVHYWLWDRVSIAELLHPFFSAHQLSSSPFRNPPAVACVSDHHNLFLPVTSPLSAEKYKPHRDCRVLGNPRLKNIFTDQIKRQSPGWLSYSAQPPWLLSQSAFTWP